MKTKGNRWGRGYARIEEKNKPQLRNGEVVTPLGTFSESVRERRRQRKIYNLVSILCLLLICITMGVCYLIF